MIWQQLQFLTYVIATRLVVGAIPFGAIDGTQDEP